MSFRKQIEEGLEQIQQMQESYRQVRDMEILPLSFFSSSYDILRSLTATLHEMEAAQLQAMQEELSKHELMIQETKLLVRKTGTENPIKISEPIPAVKPVVEVVPESPIDSIDPAVQKKKVENQAGNGFLSDAISKNLLSADLKKALSLNDRFRFQRDLFGGNAQVMNDTFDQLNAFTSLNAALMFLNETFEWNWEVEPASGLKELLEKRFL